MNLRGSGMGYAYEYRLWMDKSMIERYSLYNLRPEIKLVFETRTYFVVNRRDGGGGDEVVDSERLVVGVSDCSVSCGLPYIGCVSCSITYVSWVDRLEDYWMANCEILELSRLVRDFAKQKQKEADDESLPFVPIAVELDVCTVQKEGEPIGDTFERALRSQHMIPSLICPHNNNLEDEDPHLPIDDNNILYFLRFGIGVGRVLNVEEAMQRWMEVCHLCGQKPTIGAQIALPEGCTHHFHYHCIVEWFLKYEMACPTCRRHITDFY